MWFLGMDVGTGGTRAVVVDENGRLIGVNSIKIAAEGFEGMGFAIPVNSVTEICDNIIANKDKKKPYVGVQISAQYDESTLTRMGYPAGVVVSSVVAGSPAEAAGIKQNDIIMKINGVETKSFNKFTSEKNKYSPEETVTLTVYRNGKILECPVTLGETNG